MTKFVRLQVAMLALIGAASPASASPCTHLVARVQAQVDAAVERRAGFDSWKPESLDALRGHQPTPRSIAAAETGNGPDLETALESLDRARSADRSGNIATRSQALANAIAALRQQRR